LRLPSRDGKRKVDSMNLEFDADLANPDASRFAPWHESNWDMQFLRHALAIARCDVQMGWPRSSEVAMNSNNDVTRRRWQVANRTRSAFVVLYSGQRTKAIAVIVPCKAIHFTRGAVRNSKKDVAVAII
jgi:hypothetical protein